MKIIKLLIKNGIDIHKNSDYAIRQSAKNGHLHIVKYLIKKGAIVTAKNNYTLLTSAALGHLDVVRLLIEHGAHDDGEALIRSVKKNRIDVVTFLVENGSNIHANYDEALAWSVIKNYNKIATYLISNGANYRTSGLLLYNHYPWKVRTIGRDGLLFDSINNGLNKQIAILLPHYKIEDLLEFLSTDDNKTKLLPSILHLNLSKYSSLIEAYRTLGIDLFDMIEKEIKVDN